MTKLTSTFAVLALASLAQAGTSSPAASGKACNTCNAPAADDSSLGLGLGVSYDTDYIFRGLDISEHWLRGSVDYSIPLSETTRLNLDASYGYQAGDTTLLGDDYDHYDLDLSYQRLELGAGITTDLGPVTLGAGYRYYMHDGDLGDIFEDTHEVGATVSTKLGFVNLGLGAYYDITNEGWYFDAKASTEIKICDKFSLVPSVGIGYAVDYDWQLATDLGQVTGFTAVNVALAAPIKVCKNVTITPYVAANLPVDALDDAGRDNQVYGGVSVTVRF
jgi:hypothetical protein